MSEKMWDGEPFWGLGYEWDPDWVLTDRQKELRDLLIELSQKEMRANAKVSDDNLEYPRKNLELLGELNRRHLQAHPGESVLVVAHHVVNRTYLAGLLGLAPGQARGVVLDNCGISVVVRAGGATAVATLNAAFHLQGVAA